MMSQPFLGSGPSLKAPASSYLSKEVLLRGAKFLPRGGLQMGVVGVQLLEHPFLVVGIENVDPLGAHLHNHDRGNLGVEPPALFDVLAIEPDLVAHRFG